MTQQGPPGGSSSEPHFTATPAQTLHGLIGSFAGPLTTRELLQRLEASSADENAVETIRRLPERVWDKVGDAVAAATTGWDPPPESESV